MACQRVERNVLLVCVKCELSGRGNQPCEGVEQWGLYEKHKQTELLEVGREEVTVLLSRVIAFALIWF